MANAQMLSIDLAKRSFQVCATDPAGSILYNRTISRPKLEALLKKQPHCIVAMEACAISYSVAGSQVLKGTRIVHALDCCIRSERQAIALWGR